MRILTTCLCCVAFLLAGCGKRLSGRYESTAVGPMLMPVMSSQPQSGGAQPMPATPGMNKLTLEFDGAKARLGTPGAMKEYKYRIDDNRLDLIGEGTGPDATVTMTVEADGSITYQMFNLRKVK
jgi:hypothetical protein